MSKTKIKKLYSILLRLLLKLKDFCGLKVKTKQKQYEFFSTPYPQETKYVDLELHRQTSVAFRLITGFGFRPVRLGLVCLSYYLALAAAPVLFSRWSHENLLVFSSSLNSIKSLLKFQFQDNTSLLSAINDLSDRLSQPMVRVERACIVGHVATMDNTCKQVILKHLFQIVNYCVHK